MKIIGLLGGMSWESTLTYYKLINEFVKEELGGLHSAKIAMFSVEFSEIEKLQHQGKWDEAAVILIDAAKKIEASGADFLVICTNTMHKISPEIEKNISIPLIHIADCVASKLKELKIKKSVCLVRNLRWNKIFIKAGLKRSLVLRP